MDKCLSRALNIPLNDIKRLAPIDEENYVLTLDFTIKMLQIHERYECGEPVIIQGETGVGKTALIQMLSKLWNVSFDMELKQLKERMLEFLKRKLSDSKYDACALNRVQNNGDERLSGNIRHLSGLVRLLLTVEFFLYARHMKSRISL